MFCLKMGKVERKTDTICRICEQVRVIVRTCTLYMRIHAVIFGFQDGLIRNPTGGDKRARFNEPAQMFHLLGTFMVQRIIPEKIEMLFTMNFTWLIHLPNSISAIGES